MTASIERVKKFEVSSRDLFVIAIPASIAFITEPLAGLIDSAVIGQLGDAGLLGGQALGAIAFDFIFSLAFFLRLGTAGLTAQSVGAQRGDEGLLTVVRNLMLAVVLGVLVILCAPLLHQIFSVFFNPNGDVAPAFADYFHYRLWSAPFVFINFVLLGWFYGRAKAKTGLIIQLFLNIVNIVLSILFVQGFGWGVPGVAIATVFGQVVASIIGLVIFVRHYGGYNALRAKASFDELRDVAALKRMFGLSRDLMMRSAALMMAYGYFAAQGSRMGAVELAANALLMHLVMITSYFLDGISQGAEQISGKAVGAQYRPAFERARTLALGWGFVFSLVMGCVMLIVGPLLITMLSSSAEVQDMAKTYMVMAALTPVFGMPAFIYDGIMIGATLNVTMRNGMVLSLLIFLVLAGILQGMFGLWGLWGALNIFMISRAVFYAIALRWRSRELFPA